MVPSWALCVCNTPPLPCATRRTCGSLRAKHRRLELGCVGAKASRPVVSCHASGKGFGSSSNATTKGGKGRSTREEKETQKDEERAVERILENLELERQAQGGKAEESNDSRDNRGGSMVGRAGSATLQSVDPKAAHKGRVDYVRVEGWEPAGPAATAAGATVGVPKLADGDDKESLGNLRVRSFSRGTVGPGEGKQMNGRSDLRPREPMEAEPAEESGIGESGMPLYEKLVRHLQLLDSRGELAVAAPKGAPPLPPFPAWRFGNQRFLQYLVDLHAVHSVLEHGIATAVTSSTGPWHSASSSSSDGQVGHSPNSVPDVCPGVSPASSALGVFRNDLGVHRAHALSQDIAAVQSALSSEGSSLLRGTRAESSFRVGEGQDGSLKATVQAAAYASYIGSITKRIHSSPDAPRSLPGTTTKQSPADKACLRLFANAFAVYVAHFTTGMRIGAKAVECVPCMKEARAVRVFQEYPGLKEGDPLKAFISAVNEAGLVLRAADVEHILEELPKAVVKTSLLLSVLAVEEQGEQGAVAAEVQQ